jgi:hypothetical protein
VDLNPNMLVEKGPVGDKWHESADGGHSLSSQGLGTSVGASIRGGQEYGLPECVSKKVAGNVVPDIPVKGWKSESQHFMYLGFHPDDGWRTLPSGFLNTLP